jgi:hypothetical protein
MICAMRLPVDCSSAVSISWRWPLSRVTRICACYDVVPISGRRIWRRSWDEAFGQAFGGRRPIPRVG